MTADPITADLYTSWTCRQGNHADCAGLGLRVVPEPRTDLPCHCECHRGIGACADPAGAARHLNAAAERAIPRP